MTRDQLVALGLTRRQIGHMVARGRLIRVHLGVYAVGHRHLTPVAQASAAALACGPGAALSHGSAAALWGIAKRWRTPYEVTTPRDRRPTGIRVHTCRTLTHRDITTHYAIRVTSPARTLLQIAPRLTYAQLTRAYNDGLVSHYLHEGDLLELLARRPNDPGAQALRGLVPAARRGPTRSELEDGFLAFIERYGLPEPEMNVSVAGLMVDAWFRDQRVIVELDSWEFHGGRVAFEHDRERDAITLTEDIRTLRITHERITEDPDLEASRVRRILKLT